MDHCQRCGLQFADPAAPPSTCPNCGEPQGANARDSHPIRSYFLTVRQILLQPSLFFRSMPVRGGFAGPLAFALITHWLGEAVGFLWRIAGGATMGGSFDRFFKMAGDVAEVDSPGRHAQFLEMGERVRHWFLGAGSVIADPFLTLARIFFIALLVFIGARILVSPGRNGAPREITFESALRIVCFGLTPSILAVLPLFGGFLAAVYTVIVTVIGAREVYRIGTGRAVIVTLWPQLLLVAMFWFAVIAGMLLMLKFFAAGF